MNRSVFYTDESGNKIDINSNKGLYTLFTTLFQLCDDGYDCLALRLNIRDISSKCINERIQEIESK